jgi:hypothetical protein
MTGVTGSSLGLPLLQAINDWQIGGSAKQKARRGDELERQAQTLGIEFRSCGLMCFRQIASEKGSLWALADTLQLPETISAWTISPEVARVIKGGVPDVGYQGVIFAIPPPHGSVVVNLSRLYRNDEFLAAIEDNRTRIDRFGDGIGRYGTGQEEVVIKLSEISLCHIYEMGGYSSGREELAQAYFGRAPSPDELVVFHRLLAAAKEELGAAWMGGDSKDRVLKKIQAQMPGLRHIKQLQDAANSA